MKRIITIMLTLAMMTGAAKAETKCKSNCNDSCKSEVILESIMTRTSIASPCQAFMASWPYSSMVWVAPSSGCHNILNNVIQQH